MSAIVDALLAELDDQALAQLADRLRPYLDQSAERLMTPTEAAAQLSVHPKTLTRAAADGRVPGAQRVGKAWRFRADGLALEPPAGIAPVSVIRTKANARVGTSAVAAIKGAK
jgi:excisionase family DNA binding protein